VFLGFLVGAAYVSPYQITVQRYTSPWFLHFR
jgi:hypothetical protein